jgi:hypothetical protein
MATYPRRIRKSALWRTDTGRPFEMLCTFDDIYGQRLGLTAGGWSTSADSALSGWHEPYLKLLTIAGYHGLKNPALLALAVESYDEQVANQVEARARYRERLSAKAKPGSETPASS